MRHSVRAFTPQAVEKYKLLQALEYARYAASSKNMQPWQIAICQGNLLKKLSQELINSVFNGDQPAKEMGEDKTRIPDLYMQRARECGFSLFQHKGIARDDKPARLDHWAENYRFFGASTVILFYYDTSLPSHCLIDMGIFLERLMEGLSLQGISSCPQASLVSFPHIIKGHVTMDISLDPIFGLSIGYEDESAKVNQFRTSKLEIDEFTSWLS